MEPRLLTSLLCCFLWPIQNLLHSVIFYTYIMGRYTLCQMVRDPLAPNEWCEVDSAVSSPSAEAIVQPQSEHLVQSPTYSSLLNTWCQAEGSLQRAKANETSLSWEPALVGKRKVLICSLHG